MISSTSGMVFTEVQPNMRLKLAAPSCCGGHRFVTMNASRRSLSAVR